ncbi:hypothetical protein [Natronosalvus amylolyticus]|uniref:hypothetical protein n=1 Tax=Natronosalvus amylolyticus TaxID=2961994 RepID=UPI0020C96236|nr:hypothetical protein [Natronosalvus amylolyticus]
MATTSSNASSNPSQTDRLPQDGFEATLKETGVRLSGLTRHDAVTRRYKPLGGYTRFSMSEPFETLRDAIHLESRLRLKPPGAFKPTASTRKARVWEAYGHTVTLRKPDLFGSWTLTVNGQSRLESVERLEAFEAAAEAMFEIVERQ